MNQQEQPAEVTACKRSRRLTVGGAGDGWPRSDVPYLRLCGRWLQDAGFAVGRRVKVEIREGRLLIEPVD